MVKLDFLEVENKGARELGVGVDRRGSSGSQSSMRSAGSSQKLRKPVAREESADAQEDEPCQRTI